METFLTLPLLLERGDVYFNIQGSSGLEVIKSLVRVLRPLKPLDKEALLKSLIEREELGSTAIGCGFAIPHPRKFFSQNKDSACLVVAYLDQPAEWSAQDGKPVTTLLLVLSADTKDHLSALSELARLAEMPEFSRLIAKRPSKQALLEFLNNPVILSP
ncbi:MAG: PTS sugar transporter subunit IIA [Spirochaetia bacterium]|jgi:mannitol/fructose-specific phosphotransferase system IIA component (Ntr-type)|nr:PTS sugar transporter subunit IIA [Spirochaetales bacterium]MDX9784955.1 PTS sugar transporter subunit IIA [Spirochaetia bacterium]